MRARLPSLVSRGRRSRRSKDPKKQRPIFHLLFFFFSPPWFNQTKWSKSRKGRKKEMALAEESRHAEMGKSGDWRTEQGWRFSEGASGESRSDVMDERRRGLAEWQMKGCAPVSLVFAFTLSIILWEHGWSAGTSVESICCIRRPVCTHACPLD